MNNQINYWETDPEGLLKIAKTYVKELNQAPNEVVFYPTTLSDRNQVFDHHESRGMVALAITEMMAECIGYSAPPNIINAIKYSINSDLDLHLPFSTVDRLHALSGYKHTIYDNDDIYLKGWGLLKKKPVSRNGGYIWKDLKQIAL